MPNVSAPPLTVIEPPVLTSLIGPTPVVTRSSSVCGRAVVVDLKFARSTLTVTVSMAMASVSWT